MHYAHSYIGLPYKAGEFDCWDLVRDVYSKQYGIELAKIPVDEDNIRQLINTVNKTPERNNWIKTLTPNEGDVVLLRQSRHPIHVGVWLEIDGGGILHCIKNSGVVFQNLQSLHLSGWEIESFYKYEPSNNSS